MSCLLAGAALRRQDSTAFLVALAAFLHTPVASYFLFQLLEEGVNFDNRLSFACRGHVCRWPVLRAGDEVSVLVVCLVPGGDLLELLCSGGILSLEFLY